MSSEDFLTGFRELKKEIQALREDIRSLQEGRLAELRAMLRRRGLETFRENPVQHLLFPPTLAQEEKTLFYELFKKYSFRLFLREILAHKNEFCLADVVRYSSAETGGRYLRILIDLGVVETGGDHTFRLRPVGTASLGPTLEWFMAEILRKEFSCPALYGLRCKGTRYGGDYDVVASLEGRLVYLEVKASPPKNIEAYEVREFFSRLEDLVPHLALFFVDTELRMKDKILPLFEAEKLSQNRGPNPPASPTTIGEKIGEEIFFLPSKIYILNSKGSILRNMAVCFKHHFAFSWYDPPAGLWARGTPE